MIFMEQLRLARILMVEDNPGDVRLMQEALKECKFANEITIAGDGEEAISMLKRQGKHSSYELPDLILLDLNFEVVGFVKATISYF